jgi:hypothetical protein
MIRPIDIVLDLPYTMVHEGVPIVPDNFSTSSSWNNGAVQHVVNTVFPIYRDLWELYRDNIMQPLSNDFIGAITNKFSELCSKAVADTGCQIAVTAPISIDTVANQLDCTVVYCDTTYSVSLKFSILTCLGISYSTSSVTYTYRPEQAARHITFRTVLSASNPQMLEVENYTS